MRALDYSGKPKVAANTGVYFADLLYINSTNEKESTYNKYGAIMELTKEAGIHNELLEILLERFKSDNTSVENFQIQIKNVLANSSLNLSENRQNKLNACFVMGNQIEKLHLLSSIVLRPKQNELPKESEAMLKRDLVKRLGNQCEQLQEISVLLKYFKGDLKVDIVLREFEELQNRYA